MATTTLSRSRFLLCFQALALAAIGLAGCGGGGTETDAGTDASSEDMGDDADQGPEDMGRDLGPRDMGSGSCDGVVCAQPFFFCQNGGCVEYPRCFTSSTCQQGSFCTGLHCVPGTVDVDGDTFPAETDCDEANPDVNPGEAEVCGLADDNCSGTVDEGDAQALCNGNPGGPLCMTSICCPFTNLNIDRDPGNGCECAVTPTLNSGDTCANALSLAAVSDVGMGQTVTVSDNALPAGREVWYRFTATDSADATCDNFNVRVRFLQNPGNRYRFNVFRGCSTVLCDGNTGYTDTTWGVNTNQSGRRGQCPCAAADGTLNSCGNDTQDFMVRVRWADTSAPDCDPYELEITNGVF